MRGIRDEISGGVGGDVQESISEESGFAMNVSIVFPSDLEQLN